MFDHGKGVGVFTVVGAENGFGGGVVGAVGGGVFHGGCGSSDVTGVNFEIKIDDSAASRFWKREPLEKEEELVTSFSAGGEESRCWAKRD